MKLTENEQDKLIQNLKDLEFEGIDIDTEISLFEYGLLVREITEYQCSIRPTVYYQYIVVTSWEDFAEPKYFDISTITESELVEIFNEEWFDKKGFLSFIGQNESDYLKDMHIASVLSDMIQYYGTDNIIGSNHNPFDSFDLLEWSESELNRNPIIK